MTANKLMGLILLAIFICKSPEIIQSITYAYEAYQNVKLQKIALDREIKFELFEELR